MAVRTVKKAGLARRAEIIKVAGAILAREGAGGLSLRSVANEVGIKLASLQYYFPTFASLIEALVDDIASRHADGLNSITKAPGLSAKGRLEAVLRWLAVDAPDEAEDARLEVQFWALAHVNDDARAALFRYHGLYIDYLTDLIENAFPDLPPKETRARAISIASLLEGSILFVDLVDDAEARIEDFKPIYQAVRLIAFGK